MKVAWALWTAASLVVLAGCGGEEGPDGDASPQRPDASPLDAAGARDGALSPLDAAREEADARVDGDAAPGLDARPVADAAPRPDAGPPADSGPDAGVADVAAPSNAGWPKTFDSTGADQGLAAAVDESGAVIFAFAFGGPSIDVLGGALARSPALVSYTAAGAHRWSAGADHAIRGIAAAGGSLYTAARVGGPGGAGDDDFVLARYTTAGVHAWTLAFTGAGVQQAEAVGADRLGNAYVAGHYDATLDLGGGTVRTSSGGNDVFVASFLPDRTLRWVSTLNNARSIVANGIAVDPDGNSFVTGSFSGTVAVAGTMLSDDGIGDIYVASFDPGGRARWAADFGGNANDRGERVATGGDVVCATGLFGGTARFGMRTVMSSGTFLDMFVACLSRADGALRWLQVFGGRSSGRGTPHGIAIDALGRVHVAGTFQDESFSVGGTSLSPRGMSDLFVITFDAAGALVSARAFGGTDDEWAGGLAAGGDAAYLAGRFSGSVDFGDGARSASNQDVVFLRWAP